MLQLNIINYKFIYKQLSENSAPSKTLHNPFQTNSPDIKTEINTKKTENLSTPNQRMKSNETKPFN